MGPPAVFQSMGRGSRIFLALYVGFLFYTLVVLFFGRTGVMATANLDRYRSGLENNLASLQATNAHLAGEFDSLRADASTIRAEAHVLGYFASNEQPIDAAHEGSDGNFYSVGSLVARPKPSYASDALLRIVAVSIALCVYVGTGLLFRESHGPLR